MNGLRARLVMALAASSLVVVPSVNTRPTRIIGMRSNPDPQALYAPRLAGVLPDGRRARLRPARIPHHRQQHHDSGGPAAGRGLLLHGRPGAAARPHRPGHARSALRQSGPGVVGRRDAALHGVHDARADEPHHWRLGDAGRRGLGRRRGPTWSSATRSTRFKTALPAGYDVTEDAHAGDLRHARHLRHRRARTTTPTSSTTSGPTAARDRDLGQDHERRVQHLPQSAFGPRRLAPGRQALRHLPPARRRSTRTPATRWTSRSWSTRSTGARTCRASRPARPTSSSATANRSTTSPTSSSRRTSATARPAMRLPATQAHALVHVSRPRRLPVLPRRRRLRDGREPSRGTAGRRCGLRVLPPSRRAPGSSTLRSSARTRCPSSRRS